MLIIVGTKIRNKQTFHFIERRGDGIILSFRNKEKKIFETSKTFNRSEMKIKSFI